MSTPRDKRILPVWQNIQQAFPQDEGFTVSYHSEDGELSHHFKILKDSNPLLTFVVYRSFLDDHDAVERFFTKERLRRDLPHSDNT